MIPIDCCTWIIMIRSLEFDLQAWGTLEIHVTLILWCKCFSLYQALLRGSMSVHLPSWRAIRALILQKTSTFRCANLQMACCQEGMLIDLTLCTVQLRLWTTRDICRTCYMWVLYFRWGNVKCILCNSILLSPWKYVVCHEIHIHVERHKLRNALVSLHLVFR